MDQNTQQIDLNWI